MKQRICAVLSVLAALLLAIGAVSNFAAFDGNGARGSNSGVKQNPDGSTPAVDEDMTLTEYARLCVERIGPVPRLDSNKAVVIPITVNGKVPAKYEPCMDCDRPSLLPNLGCDGQCVPYSRVQLLRDDDEAQMVALFRRKIIRDEGNPLFDEVDLIVHSVISGDTCWFQATSENPDCRPEIGIDGTQVPAPQDPGAESFWNSPQTVVKAKCGVCHDNDPFYYSPYIAQVINHVPADPLGRYSNAIGPFNAWPTPRSVTTRGNTCTGCHRIGTHFTSGDGLLSATGALNSPQADAFARQYPSSHWMPAHNFLTQREWEVVYAESAQKLHDWHRNYHGIADATVTPIPAGASGNDVGQ